jgi:hypothetical protein
MMKYDVGDTVTITDSCDEFYMQSGKIIQFDSHDNSYCIEFDSGFFGSGKERKWYWGTDDFIRASAPSDIIWGMDLAAPPKVLSPCRHEWCEDQFFTARVYKTCKKCGARHEDTVSNFIDNGGVVSKKGWMP